MLWTAGQSGAISFFGDLRGNGRDYLVLDSGRTLMVLDGATGNLDWQKVFEPNYVAVRPAVGDILPERPGLEMAVCFQYGEEGCLLNFPPEGEPQDIWRQDRGGPGRASGARRPRLRHQAGPQRPRPAGHLEHPPPPLPRV